MRSQLMSKFLRLNSKCSRYVNGRSKKKIKIRKKRDRLSECLSQQSAVSRIIGSEKRAAEGGGAKLRCAEAVPMIMSNTLPFSVRGTGQLFLGQPVSVDV